MTRSLVAVPAVLLLAAVPAAAQDVPFSIRQSAICAPVGVAASSNAPRVAAGGNGKMLFGLKEQVAVTGGEAAAVGQRFFVRRPMKFHGAPRAQHTVAAVTIVESPEGRAMARIEMVCDAVAAGDYLEPYVEPVFPAGMARNDASGRLEPATSMQVSYGVDGHELAGGRDFMLANQGSDKGVVAGARYAVFHTHRVSSDSAEAFAEAIVVSVFPSSSLLRITAARDAVETGDRLVLRVGGTADVAPSVIAAETLAEAADEDGASDPDATGAIADGKSFDFDDLYFDFNRQTLKPEAVALLDRAIEVLQSNPGLRVSVEGYTCDIGTAEFNVALGERRAKEVRDYLVAHGVDANRLTVVSYGEEHPKYKNDKETRKLNRRAALVVNVRATN